MAIECEYIFQEILWNEKSMICAVKEKIKHFWWNKKNTWYVLQELNSKCKNIHQDPSAKAGKSSLQFIWGLGFAAVDGKPRRCCKDLLQMLHVAEIANLYAHRLTRSLKTLLDSQTPRKLTPNVTSPAIAKSVFWAAKLRPNSISTAVPVRPRNLWHGFIKVAIFPQVPALFSRHLV